jgi:hypothetical protein
MSSTYQSGSPGKLKTKQQGTSCGMTAAQKACAPPNKAGLPAGSAYSLITCQLLHYFTDSIVPNSFAVPTHPQLQRLVSDSDNKKDVTRRREKKRGAPCHSESLVPSNMNGRVLGGAMWTCMHARTEHIR